MSQNTVKALESDVLDSLREKCSEAVALLRDLETLKSPDLGHIYDCPWCAGYWIGDDDYGGPGRNYRHDSDCKLIAFFARHP